MSWDQVLILVVLGVQSLGLFLVEEYWRKRAHKAERVGEFYKLAFYRALAKVGGRPEPTQDAKEQPTEVNKQ